MSAPPPIMMPVPVAELLAETVDLTPEEFSAYQHLSLHLWLRGGTLPDDPTRLAAFAKLGREPFDRAWAVISRFFHVQDGIVWQDRVVLELERARARNEATTDKGRKGGLISGRRRQGALPGFEAELQPGPEPGLEAEGQANGKLSLKPRASRARARGEDLLRKSGSVSGSPSLRSGPLFSQILSLFSALWSEIYSREYRATPQDRSQLGRAFRGFQGAAEIEAFDWRGAFTRYLGDLDRFVASVHRHSLSFFFAQNGINKYAVEDRRAGRSDKEVRSDVADRRFDEVMSQVAGGLLNGRT